MVSTFYTLLPLIFLFFTPTCKQTTKNQHVRGCLSETYIIEVLGRPHDVRRLLIFVVLHPALSEEFPVHR